MTKKIILTIYFALIISTFVYITQVGDLNIAAVDIFFGTLFPCFFFWLIYKWLSKADKTYKGTWVIWVNWLFYLLCVVSGLVVLVRIILEPSIAGIAFMLLPFIQGLVYLVAVAVMAHINVYAKPLHNKKLKSDSSDAAAV